jgi:hypothetical protein
MSFPDATVSEFSDADTLSSLLYDTPQELVKPLKYAKRTLQYLIPTSNTYTLGVLFDMSSCKDQLTVWDQAYLHLPLTLTFANNLVPSPVFPPVAWKDSVVDLFQRVVVQTTDGRVLVDESNSIAFSHTLRLLLEKDQSFLTLVAPEIHFSPDLPDTGCVGLSTTAQLQYPNMSKFAEVPLVGIAGDCGNARNSNYNKGFEDRVSYLMRSCVSDTGVVPAMNGQVLNCHLRIPLWAIHDFFQSALAPNPLQGVNLQFQFYWQNPNVGSSFIPITSGSVIGINGGANTQVNAGACTFSITAGTTPYLYYHSVKLDAETATIFSSKMATGFKKLMVFKCFDMYKDNQIYQNIAPNTAFNHLITSQSVQPRRLFVLCYPTGLINTNEWGSIATTGANGLTQLQVQANNVSLYNQPFNTTDQFFEELKQAMGYEKDGTAQSLISFDRFRTTSRVMCFDLTRLHSIAPDPNAPMSISVQATVSASANIDIVYLIERASVCEWDYSSQKVTVKVAPYLYK